MKKILFISSLYPPHIGGGAEIIMQEQVEGLSQKGYECIVLTTKESGELSFDFVNGIKVYRVGIKNSYWHYDKREKGSLNKLLWHIKDRNNQLMMPYVSDVIREEKPSVTICHNLTGWSIAVWSEIKKFKLPIIQVLHDVYLLCIKSNMYNGTSLCPKQCLLCNLLRYNFAEKTKQVDVVVGASQYILDKMIDYKYFSGVSNKVIYNQRSLAPEKDISEWDGKRSLYLGFIGALTQAKGIEMLLKSFISLPLINAKLLVAGKGDEDYVTYLKKISEKDHRIEFIGYANPKEFFKSIDISIIPSLLSDTFPGVAIESCAYNTPTIATRIGGLPEIVIDGENGILIDPTPSALSNAIMCYYENAHILNEHKRCSRQIVNKFLNFEKMISEYSDCIENL